ncbi:hypothetical protein BGZ96_012800 [Linnemannia gamsii]|uniref:Uncharacterized protein n=1 Tax=Linnemannia gamsii TaxID=64522 RepID=A0ABQ7JQY5_9FUNG|nr:hypothetical protein BGZ96_012800 [Linnemannia gamsii]
MSSHKSNHGTGNCTGNRSNRERDRSTTSQAAAASTANTIPTNNDQQMQQEEEDEPTTVPEIDNATHIVVEHHRTGTVKTHVFSSKDGKPSLLGHEIPDATTTIAKNSFKEVFESGLEDKMVALKSLIKDSLSQTTKASLDKVETLKIAVVESENRLTAQVSLLANNSAIEQQIKTDVVPKLDSIERLLLANNTSSNRKKRSARSSTTSPHSELSGASLEHMDRRLAQEQDQQPSEKGTDTEAEDDEDVESDEQLGCTTATVGKVIEKLNSMEGQLGALCRVVIDGLEPLKDDAQEDPEMTARFGAMQEQLLSTSESPAQSLIPDRIDILMQMVTEKHEALNSAAAAATELAVQQEQARKAEDEAWKASLNAMLTSHQTGLGGLDANLLALESRFQNMDAGFQDWTRTHRMSLNVYLKYMYMVYKSTKGVENSIETALMDIRAQAFMEPERRAQFSTDLQAIRSDISTVLETLPETIASAIKRAQEPSIDEELTDASEGQGSLHYQPQVERSGPEGSESVVLVPGSNDESAAVEEGISQEDVELIVEAETPDLVIEKLVLTVENLQASIVSMIEKYGELAELVAPTPLAPTPPPRDSPDPAVITESEASEPPPRAPTVEERLSVVEEQLAAAVRTTEPFTESSASVSGENPTEAPLPPLPILRGNPNPGPSRGYFGPPASDPTAASSETAETSDPAAEGFKTEVIEDQESSEAEDFTAAALPSPGPNFLEELQAMNRRLTDLLNLVSEGQTHMHQEMQLEFLRVIDTIKPPETEEDRVRQRGDEDRRVLEDERRIAEAQQFKVAEEKRIAKEEAAASKAAEERILALDRISMIPDLIPSLEAVNQNLELKAEALTVEVRDGMSELKAGTAAVEGHIVACQNKVQLIVDGNIQDSTVVNETKFLVEGFGAKLQESIDANASDGEVLKAQVVEAIKKTEDVIVLVEDVKRISEQSLTVQEELQKQIGEWHQKHDEGIEVLGIKHGECWEAWNRKHDDWRLTHGDSIGSLFSLHDRQDRSLRDYDETRRYHHEELQGWHKIHDGRLEELEKRRCHCCMPEPIPDVDPSAEADGNGDVIGGSAPRALPIDCYGGDTSNTDPCTRRVRGVIEEFLRQILPGFDPQAASSLSHSASGVIATEPRGLDGASVAGENDPSEERPSSPSLSFTTRNSSEVIAPEPNILITTTTGLNDSLHPDAIPRGEAASYHGAVDPTIESVDATVAHITTETPAEGSNHSAERSLPNPPIQGSLPQALYDLLRPFFHPESIELATRTKELETLQEKFDNSQKEWEDNQDRLYTTIQNNNRELEELKTERQHMEKEFSACQSRWNREDILYQQTIARIQNDLDNSLQDKENLYRIGLGLRPNPSSSTPAPAADSDREESDGASDNEPLSPSPSSEPEMTLPLAGLLSEASASLRQVLDETMEQKSILHEEISTLENRKELLLQEIARMEQQCIGFSSPPPAAAAATSITQDQDGESTSTSFQETGEPVEDDQDSNYVTEDENGSMRGRSSRASRSSRAQSVLSGGNGGASSAGAGVGGSVFGGGGSVRCNRDQKRQTLYRRAHSRGRQESLPSSLHLHGRVPQLEADVKVCGDGALSETILSSKTVLTDEQYERIRSSRAEAGVDQNPDDVWSLKFDVRVKMVPAP